MAHGTPDYNVTNAGETVYRMSDLGELAVRLGSPVSHDRRGDVVWWDDVECGIAKWGSTLVGTGAAFTADDTQPKNGSTAAKLVAGSTGGASAAMTKSLAYPALNKFGVEFSFASSSLPLQLTLVDGLYTGAVLLDARLRWNRSANTIEYYTAAGAWVSLGVADLPISITALYHVMKLVIDPVARTYVRAIIDARTFDLSGIPLRVAADATLQQLGFSITNYGNAGSNDAVYIDDVIVTQNEPA